MESFNITIRAENLNSFQFKVSDLAKKANKIGIEALNFVVVKEWKEEKKITDFLGFDHIIYTPWIDIALEYEPIVLGDYEFLARLEKTDAGMLVMTVPGTENLDPRFMHTDTSCQHCNINRMRKDLFVVRNRETSEQLQVGRSCLKLFLGIDPEKVLARFTFINDVIKYFSDEEEGFRKVPFYATLETIMASTSVIVGQFGWVSKSKAREEWTAPTVEFVEILAMDPSKLGTTDLQFRSRMLGLVTDKDRENAKIIIEYVRNGLEGDSSYVHNLKVLFSGDIVTNPAHLGIIVSAYAVWKRSLPVESTENKSNEYVGEVKERLRNVEVKVVYNEIISENDFGVVALIKFEDVHGNSLVWFTSPKSDLIVDNTVTLTGTVKEHSEFKGRKQTVLSRCKIGDTK